MAALMKNINQKSDHIEEMNNLGIDIMKALKLPDKMINSFIRSRQDDEVKVLPSDL